MLSKRFRLKDASLFQKAFRSGKPFFFGNIGCKALFLSGERAKIGFAVSKKLFPRAVDRNALKRMLSDSVYELYTTIPDGWQIVFFLGKKAPLDKIEARKSISDIIRKIIETNIQTL